LDLDATPCPIVIDVVFVETYAKEPLSYDLIAALDIPLARAARTLHLRKLLKKITDEPGAGPLRASPQSKDPARHLKLPLYT